MWTLRFFSAGLAFAVELAMLVGLALWGFAASGTVLSIVAGIGAPVAVGVFWGLFLAPRAKRPVGLALRLALKLVLFGGTAVLLGVVGFGGFAVIFAVAAALSLALEGLLGRGVAGFTEAQISGREPRPPVN